MNNELERIRKKALISSFKLLLVYLPGGAEEKLRKACQDGLCPDENSSRTPPENKSE
jgi:hypothetical protein